MENEKKKSVHINRKEREYNCKSRFPLGSKNVLERVTIVDDNQSKFIKSFWHICNIYLDEKTFTEDCLSVLKAQL